MYEKILKYILYFWGLVFTIFIIKFAVSSIDSVIEVPKKLWQKIMHIDLNFDFDFNFETSNNMKLTLDKRYGVIIEGVSNCPEDYTKLPKINNQKPITSFISSSCWNGDCTLKAEFTDKIPEKLKLNVKVGHSENCTEQVFDIGDNVEVLGYKVTLVVDDALKTKLGINSREQKVRFKHATGYASTFINGIQTMTFDYDKLLPSDILMVDDEDKFTVDFKIK